MTMQSAVRKAIAAVLVLSFPLAHPFVFGAASATLSGRLVTAGTLAPITGARLHLEDAARGTFFASSPSGTDGRFDVAGLPAASYRVAVESEGRLYVVDSPLRLEAGQDRQVQLAVRADATPAGKDDDDDSSGATGGTNAWSNPVTATLIVVGVAIVVGVLVDSATD
jgi:hypothetical protein